MFEVISTFLISTEDGGWKDIILARSKPDKKVFLIAQCDQLYYNYCLLSSINFESS